MITSPRKLQKLFIKFITWGQIAKVEKMILAHPILDIPWQKAFEETIMNNCSRGILWLLEQTKMRDIILDIHFDNDRGINHLVKLGNSEQVKKFIILDKAYPWLDKILIDRQLIRKDILALLT